MKAPVAISIGATEVATGLQVEFRREEVPADVFGLRKDLAAVMAEMGIAE